MQEHLLLFKYGFFVLQYHFHFRLTLDVESALFFLMGYDYVWVMTYRL